MLFYQVVIMGVVIAAIYILTHFLKFSHRKLLILFIAVLITAGAGCLYYVQYYFGNHFYKQELSPSMLNGIQSPSPQKQRLQKAFSGYTPLANKGKSTDSLGKLYRITGNGASSAIDVELRLFSNSKDAGNYFEASQKFYENKRYIPLDVDSSKKAGDANRYLVSYIRSQYTSYTDFIYLPSKITYSSDVVIQSNTIVLQIDEVANKPVTNKAAVIEDILRRLKG